MDKTLQQAEQQLRDAGCDSPRREVRLLWERAVARATNDTPAPAIFEALLARRLAREPMSQILGHKAFWTLDFCVNQHTLTPRPDSETLVEAALSLISDKTAPLRLLDLGTGTGCLLLSLLHEFPFATGIGVDVSADALAVAALNASQLGLSTRAEFVCGNWAQGITETFDMVISNPPYIPPSDAASLMPEVRDYEPATALFADDKGLADYRRILADVPRLLRPSGHAVLELGIGQAAAVRAIGEANGLRHHHTRNDLGGIPRATIFH